MSTLTGIRNVAVAVTDQDAAVRFFNGTLGFTVAFDGETPAGRWIMLAPPDGGVALSLMASSGSAGIDTGIRFGTLDAAATRNRFVQLGVKVSDLLSWEGVPPMFSFDDPDGNRFYVIEEV